jgi:hypothetical protein
MRTKQVLPDIDTTCERIQNISRCTVDGRESAPYTYVVEELFWLVGSYAGAKTIRADDE